MKVTPLRRMHNKNGDIFHIMKSSEMDFSFGEVYATEIKPNKIKGWKLHKKMIVNLTVLIGKVLFVTYHNNEYHSTVLSRSNHKRLTIFPNIWFAFKGLSNSTSLIINVGSIEHDINESKTCDLSTFSFNWEI